MTNDYNDDIYILYCMTTMIISCMNIYHLCRHNSHTYHSNSHNSHTYHMITASITVVNIVQTFVNPKDIYQNLDLKLINRKDDE